MFNVLIVDDEPFVREGLKSVIDWGKYGFVTCGEANDGMEALQLMKSLCPDVVITDIRMPEMDGFEFIESSKNLISSNVQFIILSGYNDFQYAQKAIKNDVINYLLKPVDEEELIQVLMIIKRELEAKELLCRIKANNMIKALINNEVNFNSLIEKNKFLKNIAKSNLRYMQIQINILKGLHEDDIQSNLNSLKAIILSAIHKDNYNYLYEDKLGKYGIILNESILKCYNNSIETFANSILIKINNAIKSECIIIIGKEIKQISDISTSYKSCAEIRDHKHLYLHKNIIFYEDIEKIKYNYFYNNELLIEKLLESIDRFDCVSISSVINEMFSAISNEIIEPQIIRAHFTVVISSVITQISKRHGNVESFMKNSIYFKEFGENSISEIKEQLECFSIESSKYIKSLRCKPVNIEISEVESYIKDNYNKDLSLKKLADIFNINSVYLGQLFKKRLGVSFNDYINYIRIEEAKRLLRRSNLKLYEIASKVGFSETNYFINKFEKVIGVTPTQYKNGK